MLLVSPCSVPTALFCLHVKTRRRNLNFGPRQTQRPQLTMPPKRKHTDDVPQEDESKRYAYLKPHVRRVPEKTIKSKWTPLPEPVQEKIKDMFHSLERPVIMRNQNERKRIEAQGAVQAVVRK